MMKNKKALFFIALTVICVFVSCFLLNSLEFRLYRLIFNKNAKIGLAVQKDNRIWVFDKGRQPLLSVFKYIVALKVLAKLDKENISLNKKLEISKSMIDEDLYSPMLNKYKKLPFEISIRELLKYMISESDNNACDILIEYAGGIAAIDSYIKEIGFKDIEIAVNEKEMNKDIEKQYLNKASASDMVKLIKKGYEGGLLSKNSTDYLVKIMLETQTGQDKLKAGLPEGVLTGHKTGSSSRKSSGIKIADNDAGFVILPRGGVYYIAVFIQDSSLSDSENADLIRSISQLVYEYFVNQL